MNTLDYLTEAVHRVLKEGEDGWTWTWFHSMDAEARLKFDGFLVRMNDPLAYEAGTPEHRFRTRVLRMAALEREARRILARRDVERGLKGSSS